LPTLSADVLEQINLPDQNKLEPYRLSLHDVDIVSGYQDYFDLYNSSDQKYLEEANECYNYYLRYK